MAAGLVKLYAERQRRPGYAFGPDTPWQQEFEQSFPYPETEDQLRCIDEIKADMERPHAHGSPAVRRCGLRQDRGGAAGGDEAVLDGKQVAILVPTTVLAQQHYATARSRFSAFR